MRHFIKTTMVCHLFGILFFFAVGEAFSQNSYGGPITIVKPNEQVSITGQNGKNLDFSRLRVGEFAFVEMYDSKGAPYTFRVRQSEDGKFDVAVDPSTLGGVAPNTVVRFEGKGKLLAAVNLTQIQDQRCGVWCVLAHICCIHIHIGPPGNTWEWSCTNCEPKQ